MPVQADMRNLKIIGAIATLFLTGSLAWQIGVRELANVELRDDMHDMTSQLGARIGLMNRKSDDDFRIDVIGQARKYDIQLKPEQVTVERRGEGVEATIYLAADYRVPISLPGFSFQLHFNAESRSDLSPLCSRRRSASDDAARQNGSRCHHVLSDWQVRLLELQPL